MLICLEQCCLHPSTCGYTHKQVAASRDVEDPQQGGSRQPRGSSPLSEGPNRGQSRPPQPPRSISSASAATQDSSASEYTRTDSGESARDASGVNERRASGAAAGPLPSAHNVLALCTKLLRALIHLPTVTAMVMLLLSHCEALCRSRSVCQTC